MQFIEGTSFHASLGRTGMTKRTSFEIFVRQIHTTVRKWELCYYSKFVLPQTSAHAVIFLWQNPLNPATLLIWPDFPGPLV